MANTKIQLANEILTKTITDVTNVNGGVDLHLDSNYEVVSIMNNSGYRLLPVTYNFGWWGLVYAPAPNFNQAVVGEQITITVYYRHVTWN